MAAPGGKFFIQDSLDTPAVHHENFEQLWLTKWQTPCRLGIYPFMFSAYQDFEPIVQRLITEGQKEPYNWDSYAEAFFPKAEELVTEAKQAEHEGNQEKASELFMYETSLPSYYRSDSYFTGVLPPFTGLLDFQPHVQKSNDMRGMKARKSRRKDLRCGRVPPERSSSPIPIG